ncbi:MAG: FG-GAP repeat protein [Candidatus Sabulitectum sp.]|nr:FG-GAP repeat protein [Candidatus Sabulitectum sp.]
MFTVLLILLSQPVFGPFEQFTFMGEPLDAGLGSAPCLVDWNGDGLMDILVGTREPYSPFPYVDGGIYYLPNTGTPDTPLYETVTALEADGIPISQNS